MVSNIRKFGNLISQISDKNENKQNFQIVGTKKSPLIRVLFNTPLMALKLPLLRIFPLITPPEPFMENWIVPCTSYGKSKINARRTSPLDQELSCPCDSP